MCRSFTDPFLRSSIETERGRKLLLETSLDFNRIKVSHNRDNKINKRDSGCPLLTFLTKNKHSHQITNNLKDSKV